MSLRFNIRFENSTILYFGLFDILFVKIQSSSDFYIYFMRNFMENDEVRQKLSQHTKSLK